MNYKSLGELATYVNGYAFKPSDRGIEGLPIIRIQDLTGNSYDLAYYKGKYPSKIEINDGDVLISWSGSLGVYEWNKGKALLNQHIFKVVFDKETIDKAYFIFAVRNSLALMSSQTHGATMKHITKKDFDRIIIPYPSLDKQKAISAVLKQSEQIIHAYQEQIDLLDKLVKSRFVEMFGEPKLNPKEWPLKTVGEIVIDVRYGTSRPAVDGGRYPYLRMNNINSDGQLDLSDLKYIDIPEEEIEKCLVRKGDILFNRTNSIELVGKTAAFDLEEEMIIAGYIIRVRLNDEILPQFFSQFFNLDYMKVKLKTMAKGAVNQANINAQELQTIPIYVPPINKQQEFVDFLSLIDKSKAVIQKSLDEAQLLFDSLMQEYFG